MREQSWGLVVAVALTLGLLIFIGYSLLQRDDATEAIGDAETSAGAADTEATPAPEPQYPLEEMEPPADAVDTGPEEIVEEPLPELDQSDERFEAALEALAPAGEIDALEFRDRIIRKLVASVDNLARKDLSERIRPVDSVPGSFLVSGQVDGDLYILSPANYERYNTVVDALAELDMAEVEALYRRYYPLFQRAYDELGFPDAYFNDRVVEVIDHLLATPDVADPIRLVRPHVLYRYENPVLESLSSGQKLLIRMGPDNRETVKTVLRQFRAQITGEDAVVDEAARSAEEPGDESGR